jgi:hypothetical protein
MRATGNAVTTDTAPAPWSGWHRPNARSPWRRLCEAESFDACWSLLRGLVERGDATVVSSDVDPNHRRRARRTGDAHR